MGELIFIIDHLEKKKKKREDMLRTREEVNSLWDEMIEQALNQPWRENFEEPTLTAQVFEFRTRKASDERTET